MIDPQMPKPLEAICLKAMALAPTTATRRPAGLAEDLEHWLADEPVDGVPRDVGANVWPAGRDVTGRLVPGRHASHWPSSPSMSATAAVLVLRAVATGGDGLGRSRRATSFRPARPSTNG